MEALLPFAKHVISGQTVAVDEVEHGADCGCVCLFCDAPVQAKKGSRLIHHFAHMPRAVEEERECPASFERCVFWMARRILSENQSICVPRYDLKYIDLRTGSRVEHSLEITIERELLYKSVSFPATLNEQDHEDVAVIDVAGHPLAIKILATPTHHIRSIEPFHTQTGRMATVVVSLGDARAWLKERSKNFRQELEERLLRSVSAEKRWLYHPRMDAVRFPECTVRYIDDMIYLFALPATSSRRGFRDAKTGRLIEK